MLHKSILPIFTFFLFSIFLSASIVYPQDELKEVTKKECGEDCTKACCVSTEKTKASNIKCDADCKNQSHGHHKMMKEKNHSGHSMKSDMEGMASVSEVKIFNKFCPVKGEEVDLEAPTAVYNGKVYGFCCPGCDDNFKADPEKYSKNISEDGSKFIGKK